MIPLTDGYHAYVDAADFEQRKQWHWCVHSGYAARYEIGQPVYMHRQIMQNPEGMVVDHINSNKFDKSPANLRNVTRQQNMANARKHADGAFVCKGIMRAGKGGAWYAQIGFAGCHPRAGPFRDEAEAARAYDRMAVELFGENARVNFPEEWPPERRAQVYAEAQAKRKARRAKTAKAKRRKDKGAKKAGEKSAKGAKGENGGRREAKRRKARAGKRRSG